MTDTQGTNAIPRTKVLANGAIYDLDKKRIVANPGGGLTAWDSTTGKQASLQAIASKRRAIQDAANRMAEQGDSLSGTTYAGDMAFVQAIAEAQFVKASNPDDPKATDAARFLLVESGMAEARQADAPARGASVTLTLGSDALDAVRMLLDAVARSQAQVVDGQVVDSDT